MYSKKSDFRKFCETMWIMTKYDVLPWVVVIGLFAGVVYGFSNTKNTDKNSVNKVDKTSLFQKQR